MKTKKNAGSFSFQSENSVFVRGYAQRVTLVGALVFLFTFPLRAETIETDICVFGGTSAGIIAAVQAKKLGKTVAIAEPGKYIGGLTTGGLSATDIGNKAAIGGLSRDFYHRIARHYTKDSSWTLETRREYFTKRGSGQSAASNLDAVDATMWTFEPKVALGVYHDLLRENDLRVRREQRLKSVEKNGARITSFTTEDGNVYRAKMFIDATYEGDLMAKAGVSYHVGREANSTYGETLNGVRAQTPKHQFTVAVDPYVKPGDPSSGLLPFIQAGDGGQPGSGDKKVQAYNYRLCFTTNAANRGAVAPPSRYDARQFELLGRYLEALVRAGKTPQLKEFWNPIWMPNQKTDINNNGGFSTDFIGANYDFPEADYAARERMAREHEDYIRGFITFLATSPRVPENMRREMQQWGPCKDEFLETDGWPNQLYVREARRLVSDYVMTEKNCRYQEVIHDSVGLAAYNMDSHNCQRIVKNGRVENEGDVQVPPMKPYPISYRSIVPKRSECENLFVPICMAASHIAYGSIRMEPVFMILGESSATAAAMAIDDKVPVQQVDYARLKARLLADKQVLEWTGPGRAGVAPVKLDGLVVDDEDAVKVGDWVSSSAVSPRVGTGYIHDNNSNKGEMSVTFTAKPERAGTYDTFLIFSPHANRASNVPVTARAGEQTVTTRVNQRQGNGLVSIGRFELRAGESISISIRNQMTDGFVVVDGIQLLPTR